MTEQPNIPLAANSAATAFAGRHALILGGAKGIGQALAREMAGSGARLAIGDIDLAAAQATAAAIVADGGEAAGFAADVRSADSIAAVVQQAEARFGPVDLLINNVGAILNGLPEDVPAEEWERIESLNYGAVVKGVRAVLPAMLARGSGHIANTASFAGMYPYAMTRMAYGASKAAVINFSQNLVLYCEPRGVRVSCLVPGPVRTGIAAAMTNWSANAPMSGPGSNLKLLTAEEAAQAFARGMSEGRILIPSDDALWDLLRQWAADPDAFVRAKIAAVTAGDPGMPAL